MVASSSFMLFLEWRNVVLPKGNPKKIQFMVWISALLGLRFPKVSPRQSA